MAAGCHFLVQVKRNCRKLWETIALFTALSRPISTCEYYEGGHGRQINRCVELYPNNIELPKGWSGIQRFVKVRRWGFRNERYFHELSFYALSKPINSAALAGKAIQGHWSVENRLHWIKDVNLGEDDMSIKEPKTVAILAYLNNVSLNMLKSAGLKPTKDTFAKIANKVKELVKLFNDP